MPNSLRPALAGLSCATPCSTQPIVAGAAPSRRANRIAIETQCISDAGRLPPWRLECSTSTQLPATIWQVSALSTLGVVTIAGDTTGLYAIFLSDTAQQSALSLLQTFTNTRLMPDDGRLCSVLAAIVAMIDAPAPPPPRTTTTCLTDTPIVLHASGSTFRHRVWSALCEIPAGQTISYAELASRVDRPDAVRAVAGANAANQFAVLVPCHRVLRSDGSISGYRWGVERKRALLQRERSQR